MRLLAYQRVSTGVQEEADTIEIQAHAIARWAEREGHEIVATFNDEGVTGKADLEGRKGLAMLFEMLEDNGDLDGVVIYRMDRLARGLMIQEGLINEFNKLKKRLFSVMEPDLDGNDPTRKLFRQVLGAFAEFEAAMITLRLMGGKEKKARRGGFNGGKPPYGYKAKNKELFIDEHEADVVRWIFNQFYVKGLSKRSIAHSLNAAGIAPPKGGFAWVYGSVDAVLRNKAYLGVIAYNGTLAVRPELKILPDDIARVVAANTKGLSDIVAAKTVGDAQPLM